MKKDPTSYVPIKLTLEIPVRVRSLLVDGEVLAAKMSKILAIWEDGRKPFSVEMLSEALKGIVESAMWHALDSRHRMVQGNRMLKNANGSETSMALVLADKDMEGFACTVGTGRCVEATIVREEEEEEQQED